MNYYHSKHQAYLTIPAIPHPFFAQLRSAPAKVRGCHGSHGKDCFGATRSNQAVWQHRQFPLFLETLSSQDVTLQEGPVTLLLLGAPHIENFDFLV